MSSRREDLSDNRNITYKLSAQEFSCCIKLSHCPYAWYHITYIKMSYLRNFFILCHGYQNLIRKYKDNDFRYHAYSHYKASSIKEDSTIFTSDSLSLSSDAWIVCLSIALTDECF